MARKIMFYRWRPVNSQAPFNPRLAAEKLQKLVANDEWAAVQTGPEITTAVHVIDRGDDLRPTQLCVAALRGHENRLLQWNVSGDLRPLNMDDEEYPADPVHICIWSNGYAAQEVYSNAPRIGRLALYLRRKANVHVEFDPLYKSDAFERLKDLKGQIRKLSIGLMRPEYANRGSDGVLQSLIPAMYGPSAPSVQVSLGVGRYSRKDAYLDQTADEAVFLLAESADQLVDRLEVTGRSRRTKKIEKINFVSERLQEEVEVASDAELGFAYPDRKALLRSISEVHERFNSTGVLEKASAGRQFISGTD